MTDKGREAAIRQICVDRGIRELVHFTRVENLASILREGLLCRETLERLRKETGKFFIPTDPERLDGNYGMVSLSISVPNQKMFFKKRRETRPDLWVVLLFKPSLLWELDCSFFPANAASRAMRQVPLSSLQHPESLQLLFAEEVEIGGKLFRRSDENISHCHPTHPQAEVMVDNEIPASYIAGVAFISDPQLNDWLHSNGTNWPGVTLMVRPGLFSRLSRPATNPARSGRVKIFTTFTGGTDMADAKAKRPIFLPTSTGTVLVEEKTIEFAWYGGFSLQQKQRSIEALHTAAGQHTPGPILEISSKSPVQLGVDLSAFNLQFTSVTGQRLTVESAFQGSKVFEGGEQFDEIYAMSARDAKTYAPLRSSGNVIAFQFEGEEWPIEPKTSFYDWLYLRALAENPELAKQLPNYAAFTDIAFNPKKSFNCQARSAALYVALYRRGILNDALADRDYYLDLVTRDYPPSPRQSALFDQS